MARHMAQPPQRGFLLPEWYVYKPATEWESNIASIIWGISLGCSFFTLSTGVQQTYWVYRRSQLRTTYIILVWAVWFSGTTCSIVEWLFIKHIIPVSLWSILAIVLLWQVQVVCVLQIIANRASFLITRRRNSRRLKLTVLAITGVIVLTVGCTWIPAALQLSPAVIAFSHNWDRATKAVFAATDLALNITFLMLVYQRLISVGLTKYWSLFWVNCGMVSVSIMMDVVFIGLESTPSEYVYMLFGPVVFLSKLYIELNLAEMIAHIVRSANALNTIRTGRSGLDAESIDLVTAIIAKSSRGVTRTAGVVDNGGHGHGAGYECNIYAGGEEGNIGLVAQGQRGVSHVVRDAG